jgi:hypothetical protein
MNSSDIMKKVAELAPDKYYYIVKTAGEIKDSPFRDETLERMNKIIEKAAQLSDRWEQFSNESPGASAELEKKAGWEQFAQNNPMKAKALGAVGAGAAGVAGSALAGIAYSLAGDLFESAKRGITKSRDYKNMMSENPDLKELPAKNVQRAFSVLHRFNPEFASDPVVAGSFVRRGATFADEGSMADTKMLGDLVNARKNIHDSTKLPQVPQFPDNRSRNLDRQLKEHELKDIEDPDSAKNIDQNNRRYGQEQQQMGNAMDEFERMMGRRPGQFNRPPGRGGRRP